MKRAFGLWIVILTILLVVSCAQPEPETEAEAPAAEPAAEAPTGPDPTVVDADHYKTEFENDRVRVLRITYGPGEQSVMHYHPDCVAVFLSEHHAEFTAADGSTEEGHAQSGEHLFTPAGLHLPRNIGEEPLELVLVELKGGPSGAAAAGPDPVEVDPGRYMNEFENEKVRVLRITYGPGEESVMHFHPESVSVMLTPLSAQMTLEDGTTEEMQFEAGQQVYMAAGQHQPKNTGGEPMEVLQIELK